MDFYALARRDLQALCKKNRIAANQTNVVMADALASLDHVVGLDEFLNQPKHDEVQSPEKEKPLASVITRSMTRASTRRRTAMLSETEQLSSQTTAGRGMRNRNAAAVDKEPKVLNFTETPAASRTKKRAELGSVQLKVEKDKAEDEKNDEGDAIVDGTANTVSKTRQGKTRATVTQSTRMSTRRSTRLLEKKMDALKLSDKVTLDLEPIKMGDLIVEKELTESVDAAKDEHPSEDVDTDATVVACEVENLREVGTEGKSQSNEAWEKNERAVQFEFNTTPGEVESESNNAQGKKPTEFTADAEAENKAYNNSGDVATGVEALIEAWSEVEVLDEAWSEVEEEMQSHSAEIYGKEEIAGAESEVYAPAEVETDIEGQNKKLDEVDRSLVGLGASQEGLTSFEEATKGYVHAASAWKVAPNNGDDISELTAQVTSWKLDCPKEDCDKEMDSEVVSIAASDVDTSVVEDGNNVVLDGYLADVGELSELTAKVNSSSDDNEKPEIQGISFSPQPYIAAETQLVEAQMGHPQTQKSVEAIGVEVLRKTVEAVKDSNQVSADDIVGKKTPASASISKTNRVPLSPLGAGQMTELLILPKSSGKKMQRKDGDKENIGYAVEFGKQKKVPELIITTDEENKKTPLTKKSLLKLRKMYKEKIQMQNEKRPALQRLPENSNMAVVEEKDD